MTAPYEFPPLPLGSPEEQAAQVAAAMGAAWQRAKERERAVLDSAEQRRKAETLAQLRELQRELRTFRAVLLAEARRFAQRVLPAAYRRGAEAMLPGRPFTWTQFHAEAARSLAVDSYADFLQRSEEAGRTGERFARAVRQAARAELSRKELERTTAEQAGRQLRQRLEAQGIAAATYSDGSVHSMREYAEMATRTKTAVAYNAGTLNQAQEAGIGWVEVFDGAGCGWASHDDTEAANGRVVTLEEARAHPVSHPNCRRAFGPRPDVTSEREAAAARPSTTAEQRDDQAGAERDRAERVARAAARRSGESPRAARAEGARARRAEQRRQRLAGAVAPEQPRRA